MNVTDLKEGHRLLGAANKIQYNSQDQRWHGGGDTVIAGSNVSITTNSTGQKVISATGGSGATVTSMLPMPLFAIDPLSGNDFGSTDSTKFYLSLYFIPFSIAFTQITYYAGVGSSGSFKLGIYSEDGQNRYLSTTGTVVTDDALNTITVSSTSLTPGYYWIGWNDPVGTETLIVQTYAPGGANTVFATASPQMGGVLTITPGTIPTTFNPALVTSDPDEALIIRFD